MALIAQLIGTPELVLIGLVLLVLFGAAKIPELARSLGRAKAEFQKAQRESEAELKPAAPGASKASDEGTLRAARELGIPTDGRSLEDIKADIRKKLSA